jgi:tetratricopeptide (TPR) repeat protein
MFVTWCCNSPDPVRLIPLLFILFILAGNPISVFSQTKLSKKESKAQENKTKGTRYFIEGEKALVLGELEKSFFYLQKAQEFSPDEPAISYKLAEVLVRSNQAEKALPFAEKAVNADPNNKYYALMVAEIYSNLKQPLKAAAILDRLTTESDKNQQYNLDLASIYLSANEFDKALVVLDRAEEYYGIREPFTVQKQRIYLRKNNLPKAIEEGQKLIEAFPGNPNYVLNLVEILYNNAKLDDALSLVLEEIDKYPDQAELQMAAYTLLKEKGQTQKATEYLIQAFKSQDLDAEVKTKTYSSILQEIKTNERDALLSRLEDIFAEVNPNNSFVLAALGERKKSENNLSEALVLFKKSLAIQPKNAPILEEVILSSFGENANFEELESYTIMGVDEFPEAPEFWFYDGVVKSARKKDSLAVVSLEKALTLNAGKNQQLAQVSFGSLGNSLYNLGQKDSAFVNFERALKLNPNDDQVLNNYAYFLSLEKRELEKAKTMAERVVRKNPKNSTFLDTYAWVLFQMGKYEEALRQMDEAIKNDSNPSGVMLEHYGDILYHLGKIKEAISWWKKAEGSSEASDKLSKKIKEGKYYE